MPTDDQLKFVIPHALAQAIADYLAMRPYVEVEQLIAGLRALAPLAAPTSRQRSGD